MTALPMKSIDQIFLPMARDASTARATLIVCLFTGSALPRRCAPMLRRPAPPINMPFDATFPRIFAEATQENPAVHDGAVMVGRVRAPEGYRLVGWSFRLFPEAELHMLANRGSAFNSAHAMSRVPTVDAVYWLSGGEIYRFTDGASERVGG
jgi:hypothetical protein